MLAEAERVSAGSAQVFVTALRAFLRFCYIEGRAEPDYAYRYAYRPPGRVMC